MINNLRINESVAGVMKSMGVGRKALVEAEESPKPAEKKKNGYISYYNDQKHEAYDDTVMGAKRQAIAHFKVKKQHEHKVHTHLAEKGGEPVIHTATESEEEAKDAIADLKDEKSDAIETQPEGHDEEGEIEEDPTREKLETAADEAAERKGGAAELAADLRVSIRIEKMNIGRYNRMLAKHDMSESGQAWLKEKIKDIQDCIDDMQERIPGLEKEAAEDGVTAEAIKEDFKFKLRKAIVEIANGPVVEAKKEKVEGARSGRPVWHCETGKCSFSTSTDPKSKNCPKCGGLKSLSKNY